MRLAGLIWIMLATVLVGAIVTAILSVPSLSNQAIRLIPMSVGGAALVAIPIAILLSRHIRKLG